MVKERTYRRIIKYLFLCLGSFILGFYLFNSLILPRLVGRGDIIIVPDLVGVNVKVAEERCRESGLKLLEIARCNSEEIPEDYIIEQKPESDEGLKGGRSVKVVVSSGKKMETVPDVRNKSLREASLLLESAGLKKGRTVRIYSHRKGESHIVSTSPHAGMEVPNGSKIDLLLSMRGEPEMYVMPDLVGRDLPFVKEGLKEAGFNVARITLRLSEDQFPNTILSQNPPAGAPIKEGGAIELVVSTVE